MTTLSHVKFERCFLEVQVIVRVLLSSCQREIFEVSLEGMQYDPCCGYFAI